MLDIKFVRENPEIVKENIRKKFQDSKLPLVDEVIELDQENRTIKQEVEALRAQRNKLSKQIGGLMAIDYMKVTNEQSLPIFAYKDEIADIIIYHNPPSGPTL